MKRVLLLSTFYGLLAAGQLACGDVGNVSVKLDFADDGLEAATRRLLFVVREEPAAGNGCAALWSKESPGLAENRSLLDYPNRNDIVAAPVMLSRYPQLSLFVYAYPSRDITVSAPVAGGCQDVRIDPTGTTEVLIRLEQQP